MFFQRMRKIIGVCLTLSDEADPFIHQVGFRKEDGFSGWGVLIEEAEEVPAKDSCSCSSPDAINGDIKH
ncbi:hypothetical protein COCNU_10G008840 [Cocos nucifera]|uniref:Uncharacterized protein n=1 Tax=Cocos nucifera TaxID=13894 RepID=A0A8K0N821_COCNU|nr:hypothetical protein COCNU_10G008840 [Cocos nucifera]